MTAPETAALRFGAACLLGLPVGLWYGFLRPLRLRHPLLADSAFLAGLAWAWIYLGFAVCGGDLRLGYGLGLGVGALAWEETIGKLLRRPFGTFWKKLGRLRFLRREKKKKILKKAKNMFASAEKWVTIKWNNRRHSRQKPGGRTHGRNQKSLPRRQGGLPPEQGPDQGGGHRGYLTVYGSAADP